MKSEEILRLYAQGERNFRGLNLKGQSFRGKDLRGADFSKSDIRGTDFTGALLQEANFSHAKGGLQHHHVLILAATLVSLAVIVGVAAGFVDMVAELKFHSSRFVDLIPKWLTLGVLVSFAIVSIRNGLAASFTMFILAFVLAGVIAYLSSDAVIAAGAIAIAITLASFVGVATVILVVLSATAALAVNPALAIGVIIAFGIPFLAVSVPISGGSAVGLGVVVIVMSISITWRALRGDQKHAPIVRVASFLAYRWGTSFRRADLTKANFTYAILRNTDFDDANLTHIRWEEGGKSTIVPNPA